MDPNHPIFHQCQSNECEVQRRFGGRHRGRVDGRGSAALLQQCDGPCGFFYHWVCERPGKQPDQERWLCRKCHAMETTDDVRPRWTPTVDSVETFPCTICLNDIPETQRAPPLLGREGLPCEGACTVDVCAFCMFFYIKSALLEESAFPKCTICRDEKYGMLQKDGEHVAFPPPLAPSRLSGQLADYDSQDEEDEEDEENETRLQDQIGTRQAEDDPDYDPNER